MSAGERIRRGLAWSALNTVALRLGSLALGILLARLLTPEQFGVYAVALSVQAVLMTLADLGLSADLVRSDDVQRRSPTVASLGLVTGAVLAIGMAATAAPIAQLLGSPDSAPVLALLAITLLLAGAGVVPYALLQRRFDQRRLFFVGLADFVLSTVVTLALIAAGWGVLSLAVGRVVAASVALVLQFAFAGVRPRYGLDRALVPSVLRFGVPVAVANLLSWAVLGSDKIVVALLADPVALGFYVLAFNISTWPMTAVGQVVRSIALPAFSRIRGGAAESALAPVVGLTWTLGLPLGILLATLATPLVRFVYGDAWLPAAPALAALGLLGAIRVVFDLFASALLAAGAAGPVARVQLAWLLGLLALLVPATALWGFLGAAWAHVATAALVVLPGYLLAFRGQGYRLRPILGALWPPLLAGVPAALLALGAGALLGGTPWLALIVGTLAGLGGYALLILPWARRRLAQLRAGTDPTPTADTEPTPAAGTPHALPEAALLGRTEP
ncbi:oligosaccharide flippase family protein [Microbacteriaceae bacterium VKM Ac-2854]|nr:oligosaccharide flippase family protein [Microbacteriaceae bacterium VKM Ac-2854]